MDAVDELIIKFRVDSVPFEASILSDGRYVIYGPMWGGEERRPVLQRGRLGFGFALPGLQRSLTEIVKGNLKSKSA